MVLHIRRKADGFVRKNELIKELESIKGNPTIFLVDAELGYQVLGKADVEFLHKHKENMDEYVDDYDFRLCEFNQNNYRSEPMSVVVLKTSAL